MASNIATYQLFYPDDENMVNNKKFFVEEGLVMNNTDWFAPRNEGLTYFLRDRYEKQLMAFIETNFLFDGDDQIDIHGAKHVVGEDEIENNNTQHISKVWYSGLILFYI